MNRKLSKLKKEIPEAFEAPKPDRQKKESFLKTLPQPQISMPQFILIQAAYLRKKTLFLSILLLLPALAGAYCTDANTLWNVSAIIPFLGLFAVAEGTRSMVYGMDEFEMSTRFSLKSVMLARMSILGLVDLFILFCLIPLCCIASSISLFRTGIYLLVPYMLTVNISLWIAHHFHSKDVIYACMSIAVLVSTANAGLHIMADFVYLFSYIKWWLLLSVLLFGGMVYEIYSMIAVPSWRGWSSGCFPA